MCTGCCTNVALGNAVPDRLKAIDENSCRSVLVEPSVENEDPVGAYMRLTGASETLLLLLAYLIIEMLYLDCLNN
jgi:hypothetical protein